MGSAQGPSSSCTDAAPAVIAAYAPALASAEAAAFARAAVGEARPRSPGRAKALLWAASRLAAFGESVGIEPRCEVLLRDALIERFVGEGVPTLSAASRRTLRTNLRALARALAPAPAPASLSRERAKAPYSDAELDGYLRLAAAQPTPSRRMRATALVSLGAGAGLIGAELRHLRGRDISRRSGGLVVAVSGPRARVVPVIARFQRPLGEAAALAGDGWMVGGADPARRNLTSELCAALSADPALPRLEPGRLRSSWLLECARAIGLGAFMQAAGVRCSQRLGDLAARLPEADERELVALLGGADAGAQGA